MRVRSRRVASWLAIAVLTVSVLGAAGCGDDDGDGASGAGQSNSSATETTTTTNPTASPTKVKVGLADYSFDMPATLTAGPTEFEATNSGKEEHHMTLVKLKDGQTIKDVIAVLSGDVAQGLIDNHLVAGPQAVAPGKTQSMITDLEAGNYVVLCAIPSADHLPHAAKGMIKELTVSPATQPTSASGIPDEPRITLKDFTFELPEGFDGQGTFRVQNAGTNPHEIAFYRVADGTTYDDAVAIITGEKQVTGPPPVSPAGGVTAISPGQVGGMVLDLEPGTYVALCFLPAPDGQTHFQHGMVKEVKIT